MSLTNGWLNSCAFILIIIHSASSEAQRNYLVLFTGIEIYLLTLKN